MEREARKGYEGVWGVSNGPDLSTMSMVEWFTLMYQRKEKNP
jgi:hypothetical protein